MSITMTITAQNPEELFSTIKGCAVLISDDCPTAMPPEPDKPEHKTTPAAPATAAPTAPAPIQTAAATASVTPIPTATTAPQSPVAPQNSAVPTAPPPAPAYTYEAVAKAGADLAASRPDLMPTLTALLQKFGVQAVTELKQEQLGPFAAELRQLGAKI